MGWSMQVRRSMPRALLIFCLGALALTLGASEARATHVSCGDVITADTTLDSDLVNCPGDGLFIGADNVTLDLDGHTIDGTLAPGGYGVYVEEHQGVRIQNGAMQDFVASVFLVESSRNVVTGLTAPGGIMLENASENLIAHNTVPAAGAGVKLYANSDRNRIEFNVLSGSGNGVFLITTDPAAGQPGGNTIVSNLAFHNDYGVVILSGEPNRVERNSLVDSEYGMYVSTPSVLDRNRISDTEIGIWVIGSSTGLSVTRNRIHHSEEDGILIEPTVRDIVVAQNVVTESEDDGIDANSPRVTLTANIANDNGDLGIEAVPGVTDGGGNRASGNGNPLQCTNVVCR